VAGVTDHLHGITTYMVETACCWDLKVVRPHALKRSMRGSSASKIKPSRACMIDMGVIMRGLT
jgi:hypothetical protein